MEKIEIYSRLRFSSNRHEEIRLLKADGAHQKDIDECLADIDTKIDEKKDDVGRIVANNEFWAYAVVGGMISFIVVAIALFFYEPN